MNKTKLLSVVGLLIALAIMLDSFSSKNGALELINKHMNLSSPAILIFIQVSNREAPLKHCHGINKYVN